MKYTIREIEARDNKKIEEVIRNCLIEFGANHEGTAWADPNLGRFSEIYNTEGNKYWVAENEDGEIIGGVGIGKLHGTNDVCELQKMYCIPEIRGQGISHELIKIALEYAKKYYSKCYLETLSNMLAAQKFYEKYRFTKLDKPIVQTEHFACDVRYIKELEKEEVMIEIKFDKDKKQSIAYDKNVIIGECNYIETKDSWNIVHTQVSNLYQGQGIAKRLVESIIENGKKYNKNIIAECSYAKKVLENI